MSHFSENPVVPLYEDNHLLVVNKPAGYLSQGDKTGDKPIVEYCKQYIKVKYDKPGEVFLGLCHRLDRPVSGVLMMARTSKALTRINGMLAERLVSKEYWAISDCHLFREEGEIKHTLWKDRKSNRVKIVPIGKKGSKEAVTLFRLLERKEGWILVQLIPVTGRSHQLRVAMQKLGAPILGDVKYGGSQGDPNAIALHCRSLEFTHPVKKVKIRVEAPMPDGHPWHHFVARP